MRHTKSHTKNRRSHHALSAVNFMKCENCQTPKPRHTVCPSCGFYRGKKVLDMVKKTEKRQKKAKAREATQK